MGVARFRMPGAMLLAALSFTGVALGQDKELIDLQEDLPTRLEDAIASSGLEWQGSTRFRKMREGPILFDFEPTLQWGFERTKTQLQISSLVTAGPGQRSNSGDVQTLFLQQLNDERRYLPAFAVSLRVDAPTGEESAGLDTRLKGLITKTLGQSRAQHRVHLNGSWLHNAGRSLDERGQVYAAAAGYSRLLGDKTLLIADFSYEQQRQLRQDLNVAELGLRRAISKKAELSFGVAMGFGPQSPRVQLTLGIEQSF